MCQNQIYRWTSVDEQISRGSNEKSYHYEKQIDLVCKAMVSRGKIIDALIEDIIQLIQSACLQRSVMQLPNCQTFVIGAMKAMGIKNPPKMTGKLSEYFEG